MNDNIKAIAISIGIVLLVFGIAFVLGSLLPEIDKGKDFFTAAMPYLATVNLVLMMALLYTYVKAYLKMKSEFTLGIILFISSLLMFVVVSNHTLLRMFGFDKGFIFMDITPMIFSALSLVVLIYISNR